MKLKDITGMRSGMVVALNFSHKEGKFHYWDCRCDCGNMTKIRKNNFLQQKVKSCGCKQNPIAKKLDANREIIRQMRAEKKQAVEIAEYLGVKPSAINVYISRCNCNGIFL